MKKLLTGLFFISLFITSCKKQEPTPPTPIFNNVDYGFTVILDGVTYKIKGNTLNGTFFNTPPLKNISYFTGGRNVYLELKSIAEPNYISGNLLNIDIDFANNFNIGNNNPVTVQLSNLTQGFTSSPTTTFSTATFNKINDFVITDIGVKSVYDNANGKWNYGTTLKGNYSGTIYTRTSNTNNNFTIPKPISIEFEAYRL